MGAELELIIIGLTFWLLYKLIHFYWFRVFGCGFLLVFWGAGSFLAPLYVSITEIQDGNGLGAIGIMALGAVLYLPWFFGIRSAYKWVTEEIRFKRWTHMPWNAE